MAGSNSNALVQATALGTVAQLAMVIAGHYSPTVANLFAVGGMGISLLAGLYYGRSTMAASRGEAARGGAIAGGACGLIGIAVSYLLGDVDAVILAFGTLGSTATGAIGGLLARRGARA
jgi:hypothetical protein